MLSYIEYLNEHLNIPTKAIIVLVIVFLLLQIVGELLEFKGKIVPEFLKIRKYFKRKKEERNAATKMLEDVRSLLNDVNKHYDADNIQKRNSWMKWVNDRAEVYDQSIIDISDKLVIVSNELNNFGLALDGNTRMTEEMFVQNSRDRIIDFAAKVGNEDAIVSREEFNRIFKVYEKYKQFNKEHGLTNGEIDISMHIIEEIYRQHVVNHTFIEDIRGLNN